MNVVPYIDVMLVLLVIFMVTAPLLKQGIEVELPQASATALSEQSAPLIINIDAGGKFYINVAAEPKQAQSLASIVEKVSATLAAKPQTQVHLGADFSVAYGSVVALMNELKAHGVLNIGLLTTSPPQ